MTDSKLSEAEVKRVLTLAMAQPKKDTGSLSLDDLKAGAGELGVPPHKLDDAYRKMRDEQVHSRAVRKQMVVVAAVGVAVVAGIGGFTMFGLTKPAPQVPLGVLPIPGGLAEFAGSAHVTVTSRVGDDSRPVDALPRVRIASMRGFEVFASLSGLKAAHLMRCDLVDDAGTVLETDTVQLKEPVAEPHYVWFKMAVPFNRKPGTYKALIYADAKKIAETPIVFVIGNAELTTAPAIKDGATVDARMTFSKKSDKQIFAYFHLDSAEGTGANVEFTWVGPDGAVDRNHTIAIVDAKGPWAIWDVLDGLSTKKVGIWTITAKFEGTLVGEAQFELK